MHFDFEYKKIYKNLHLIENQLLLKNENKQKSAIYLIYNNVNKKFYVGSASTNRINMRFRNHCINASGSKLVNLAINKYGLHNFYFIILEYYPGFVKKENLDKNHIALLEKETFWINKLNPEYNILTIASSYLGYKHSEDTKLNISINYSNEIKEFCKNLNIGKKWTEERKLYLSKITKLRNENIELRRHLSKLLGQPIILYNKDLTIHSEYPSIKQMALSFKSCRKTISKAIKNQTIFKDIGIIKKK